MLSKLRKLLVAKAASTQTVAEAKLVLPRILWIRDVIYDFIDRVRLLKQLKVIVLKCMPEVVHETWVFTHRRPNEQ